MFASDRAARGDRTPLTEWHITHQWLRAEFRAAQARVRPHHIAWLEQHGVSPTTLAMAGGFGVARILYQKGRFEISENGKAAIVLPALDLERDSELTSLYDVVAFCPSEPAVTYRRRGEALWLGVNAVSRAIDLDETLTLYRSPLSWLQAGTDGAAVIDWKRAAQPLCDLSAINAEDPAFAAEIDTYLRAELLKALPAIQPVRERKVA